ncbi:acid-sensing ion channel 3 [Caerostris extrusa]|uniref:Acid-sensing ion channel 3 n=1 Tax=Caerostris extrusa TaxID=172846 RepID=A0AAV4SS81_CAEEX|nr:acid-sensing ion channel 3 [Caerostris extrusa]
MMSTQHKGSNCNELDHLRSSSKKRRSFYNNEKMSMNLNKTEKLQVLQNCLEILLFMQFQKIDDSPFSLGKIFWLLVLITCFTLSVYKIYAFCHLFFKYPVVVSFEIDRKDSLEFPAVSVCNLNPLQSGINPWSDEPVKLTPDYKLIFSERRSLQNCNRYNNGTFAVNEKNEKRLKFLMKYYTISDEQRLLLGINTSEFLDECSFNNRRCSSVHLTNFSDLRYGNCISFNKKLKGEEPLRISETGFGSGLILKFRLNHHYYLGTTHTLGAKVVIHGPKDSPDLEEEGYIIGPGNEISVSLKQTIHQRLPAPYKDKCLDYGTQTNAYMRNRK